jgi:hypothetical protein
MSYLAEIKTYLTSTIPATCTSTNTFINFMPASPASSICLYGNAGQGPLYTTNRDAIARPGLQVRVRDPVAENAWTNIKAVETALKAVINSTLSGTVYLGIIPSGSASVLGWNNNSITLTQNYDVMRSE